MALSKKRMDALKKRWKKSKAPERFIKLPTGTYQCVIDKVSLDNTKKGKWLFKWSFKVIGNKKYNGRIIFKSNDLLWEPSDGKGNTGLDYFKGDLETIGFDMPELDDKGLKKLIKALKGTTVEIYLQDNKKNSQFQDCFLNQAVNDNGGEDPEEEEEDDEEEVEEEDEDEEENEEDEEDDEEEEEPEPPKKKKGKKKATPKKEVDEDEEDDLFDDDDDEEWED